MDDDTMNYPDNRSSADSFKGRAKSAGQGLAAAGQRMMQDSAERAAANANRQNPVPLPSYKRGGTVRKTGLARLHKGEYVVKRSKAKRIKRMIRRKAAR